MGRQCIACSHHCSLLKSTLKINLTSVTMYILKHQEGLWEGQSLWFGVIWFSSSTPWLVSHHSHSPSCWPDLPLLNAQFLAPADFANWGLALVCDSKSLQSGKVRLRTLLSSVVLQHGPFNGYDEWAGSKGRAKRPVTAGLWMAPKCWVQTAPG